MTARSRLRFGLIAIVAFALGLFLARALLTPAAPALPVTERATILPQPRLLPALALVDQDGQPMPAGYLRDRWTLVFFGFTQCPDVCPTTLAMLAQLKKELADLPVDQQPHVLLISVDPERDTPAVLKAYVSFFDPAFAAATGTVAGATQAATAFSVPFAKVPLPGGGYTMDHGAGLFVVSPAGALAGYFSPPLAAPALARDFRKLLAYYKSTHG
jgi:protein SCO1/2